jgi:DNA-binding CsgD family transcriptional regulator/tetratricopeptide (TPR) repeat protein
MPQLGPLVSPILVGRDDLLALADRRIGEAAAGHGGLLLVTGEPGIGKTRLIQSIRQKARQAGFRGVEGGLVPNDSLLTLAAVLDLARTIKLSGGYGSLGDDLLAVGRVRGGDSMGARRQVVQDTVDLLVGSVDRPTVFGFEDLQWADELTLEVLTELARAARELPLFLYGTYRSDELPAGSIHREWRARLVTQRLAEEVRLARLTRDETALVTTLLLGTGLPAPREVADAVYRRTNGIPLHIEELLAVVRGSAAADGRAILDAAVPDSIEDAILAHAANLSDDAGEVVRAGAIIGRCFYPDVLAGILDRPVAALDDALDELVAAGILYPFEWIEHGYYDFRHQLLRDAIYSTVPKRDLRVFHARAAEFGANLSGASDIHASVHYERAGLRDQAFHVALSAAQSAVAVHSNREALELYRRALDNMPASLPDGEKAGVFLGYADAAGDLDLVDLSREMSTRARELAVRGGNAFVATEGLINLSLIAKRDGTPVVERRDLARRLLLEIDRLPSGSERNTYRVTGLWILAIVELDDLNLAESRRVLEEALEIGAGGSARGLLNVRTVLAELDMIEGRIGPAFEELHRLAADARADQDEGAAVNSYRILAADSIRALDYGRTRIHLAEGLAYADEVQQSFCGHTMASTKAVLDWAAGAWADAVNDGGQALSDPGSFRARVMANWALGWTAAGRGDRAGAEAYLAPAYDVARHSGILELQLPAQWGLAEAALMAGDTGQAIELCEDALSEARQRGEWGLLAPFVVTGVRAYQLASRPEAAARWLDQIVRAIGPLANVARPAIDHGIGLVRLAEGSTGLARDHLEAASRGWDERGRRWEALWARLDLASTFLRSNRFADASALIREVQGAAEAMGSEPLLARAGQLSQVARGRGEELEPWHPLTTREFEVARKIAEGLTNAEIGEQLFVSPKTVSSHIEHILAKLHVSRRAEIAAWTSTVTASPAPMEAVAARR